MIKDIILQRSINHKQHLQKVDALRRPSTGGADMNILSKIEKPENHIESNSIY